MKPTPEHVDAALRANAEPVSTPAGDYWRFDGGYRHEDASARAIVEACLILGVPITDTLTGEAWRMVVTRLARLEERFNELHW